MPSRHGVRSMTPDNAGYYYAAYTAAAAIYLLYAGTIAWRYRALRRRRGP